MVYETDFYSTRRPYTSSVRPTISSYSATSGLTNPRVYTVHDSPTTLQYSYSSKTEKSTSSTSDPYSRPTTSSYSSTSERRSTGGPGGYSYASTISTGSGPGGYSYTSSRTGPYGSRYSSFHPYHEPLFYDDNSYTATTFNPYTSAIREAPSYPRVSYVSPQVSYVSPQVNYISRPSFRYNNDSDDEDYETQYRPNYRYIPRPITRAISPPRVYYPNISSHVQYITSPITRAAPLSVKSSDLSRELEHIERKFGRLERKHRRKVGASDSEDESLEDLRPTRRLAKQTHELASSIQGSSRAAPKTTYSRFDPDLMDKYGKSLIENEVHVNKNILRPTRSTRDRIEILSRIKYQEPTKRASKAAAITAE